MHLLTVYLISYICQ